MVQPCCWGRPHLPLLSLEVEQEAIVGWEVARLEGGVAEDQTELAAQAAGVWYVQRVLRTDTPRMLLMHLAPKVVAGRS